MRAESETEPDAVLVQYIAGTTAHVRLRESITAVQRTDDSGTRTVYEYDEVEADVDASSIPVAGSDQFNTLFAAGKARESASGTATLPAGQTQLRIPHGLGVAPSTVTLAPSEARVFTVSSDAILVMVSAPEAQDLMIEWSASI